MGLFNQFLEVIEWTDSSNDTLAYRFPVHGNEIKNGASLTVRESQLAIFIKDGQIGDIFGPGRYQLTGGNTPILSKLGAWAHGFNSPFKSEVYFINTKQFLDVKWGTANPIPKRDTEFGVVRIKAFGNFAYKVENPEVFLREVLGTKEYVKRQDLDGQLKALIVSSITDTIGETKLSVIDLAMNYDEIGFITKEKATTRFALLGLNPLTVTVENISMPAEVEKYLDKKTSMNLMGDMRQYQEFQKAEMIGNMGQGEGNSTVNSFGGLAAGMAAMGMMKDAFSSNGSSNNANQTPKIICPKCNAQIDSNMKFCPECGSPTTVTKVPCIKCGAMINQGLKFCSECGANQQTYTQNKVCSKCGNKLQPGDKFCMNCGNKVD